MHASSASALRGQKSNVAVDLPSDDIMHANTLERSGTQKIPSGSEITQQCCIVFKPAANGRVTLERSERGSGGRPVLRLLHA